MSKKKIYDIVPPKRKNEYFASFSEKPIKEKKKNLLQGSKCDNFLKTKIPVVALLVIFILIIFWTFSSAKETHISIWPQINEVNFSADITFSSTTENLILAGKDLSEIEIPASLVELEEVFTQEFPASPVRVEEKAAGVIRVYNKHSRSIRLIAGTRLLSATEPARQFHTQKGITIPAAGNIDVAVVASESGDSYNIEPSAFSVPGLRNFSPPQLYYDIYGKSSEKMKGGRIEEVRKVTQEDFLRAEPQLLDFFKEKVQSFLQEKVGDNFQVLEGSIEWDILESGPVDAKIGQEKDSFVYAIKVKIKALKVQKNHLTEFAQAYIKSNIPGTKNIVENSLKVNLLKTTQAGLMRDIQVMGKIYTKVDEQALKDIVKERTKNEAIRYIWEIVPEMVKPPEINLTHFWARKTSSNLENIKIELFF